MLRGAVYESAQSFAPFAAERRAWRIMIYISGVYDDDESALYIYSIARTETALRRCSFRGFIKPIVYNRERERK